MVVANVTMRLVHSAFLRPVVVVVIFTTRGRPGLLLDSFVLVNMSALDVCIRYLLTVYDLLCKWPSYILLFIVKGIQIFLSSLFEWKNLFRNNFSKNWEFSQSRRLLIYNEIYKKNSISNGKKHPIDWGLLLILCGLNSSFSPWQTVCRQQSQAVCTPRGEKWWGTKLIQAI